MKEVGPISFKRPTKDELVPINQLILRSKAHWNYSAEYLKSAGSFSIVTLDWLDKHLGLGIYQGETLVGFVGVEPLPAQWSLEHLWIDPKFIKSGIGRKALFHLIRIARQHGIGKITLFPDPPAEGFYLKLGARFTGKEAPSRVPGGPIFNEMILDDLSLPDQFDEKRFES